MKKNVALFVILSIVASALNYAAYPLLGRILPADQYIDITVSLSILTQITTFLSSIIAITIGLTKEESSSKDTIATLQSILFRLFIILIGIFLLVAPYVFNAISTPILFAIPIAVMMIVSLPITVASGYLNGKQLMIHLGLLAVISAAFQITMGTITAYLFASGIITMLSMALAQVLAILFIYQIFKAQELPRLSTMFSLSKSANKPSIKSLALYTAAASISVMLINMAQIADLLIVKTTNDDVKFYTDLYVISRVMFFAGMIFIWPFLGSINIRETKKNRLELLKLVGIISVIAASICTSLYLFGDYILYLLLGVQYNIGQVATIGSLAVVFKLLLLIVTALTLYFVVFRKYTAVVYTLLFCILLISYATLINNQSLSSLQILQNLTSITAVWAVIGGIIFYRQTR